MQVRNININPFLTNRKYQNDYCDNNPHFYKNQNLNSKINFNGIQTQKEFRELTRNRLIHCFYCKTPMLNPKYLDELKESGIFSGPVKDFVAEIAPYKEYLKPANQEIFEHFEQISKHSPQTTLSRIIQNLNYDSIVSLRKIQNPILEKIEQEGRHLPPKCKNEFRRIMEIHKNRLNGIPQLEEFSEKDFAYKLERCCDTINNNRIKQELIQYAQLIKHPALKENILYLPEKVMKAIFKDKDSLNYSLPINARSIQLSIVEDIKKRGVKLGREDITGLCKNAERMLMNNPVAMPFSNKNLGYDLSTAIKEHATYNTYERIVNLLKKLPTSDSNTNSFIIKHRLSDSDTIGYYLLKSSNCTIEHLIPESTKKPIVNRIWDWVLACAPCNNKRSNGALAKYLEKYPYEHQQTYFNDIAGVVNDGILDLTDFLIQRNVILTEGHLRLGISKISPDLLKKEFGGDNPQKRFNKYIDLAHKGLIAKDDLKELKKMLHKRCGIIVHCQNNNIKY